ncbi:hypothetical protein GCM10010299_09840 [Streptomyces tanashiensis]|nr:hypothetical protein GCM10010299_09840 [Streptomyces tanashiensis]
MTEDQVRAIYDLVKYAPTAFNQSPLRVVLIRSDEARERLVDLVDEGNRRKTAAAPLTAILSADNEFHEELPALLPHSPRPRSSSSPTAWSARSPHCSTRRSRRGTSSWACARPSWQRGR